MSQYGYGHNDPMGAPFDFYTGAVAVAAGTPYTIQGSGIVLAAAAAVTIGAVTLPLNPPDGAVVEISSPVGNGNTVTLTVAANTGDLILGTALTSLTTGLTARYKYTLPGFVVGNSQAPNAPALNARTWIRTA